MVRRSRPVPPVISAWRLFGATLAGFAVGVQLLLSGLMIGHGAAAADQPALSVICSHTSGAGDPGVPAGPDPHGQCSACACPQSAKLFAAPPAAPSFTVVLPRSEVLRVAAAHAPGEHHFYSPYASRAPPHSA
jgi:hypothetical protein